MSDVVVRPVGAFKHVHVESLRHCPHPPAHTLVAVGPSIHPAQSGGALRANGLCEPKAAGLRANGLCEPKAVGLRANGLCGANLVGIFATHRRRAPIRPSRPDAGDAQALVFPAEGDLCVTRPVGDSVAEMPGIPSGEPPNLDSRLRGNDGCAKVSGGGNPSPSSFDTLSSSALHPPDPIVRAIRSPRVAPMLQRRVSRGARRGFRPDRPTSPRLAPSWFPSAAARRRRSPSPLPSPVEGEGVGFLRVSCGRAAFGCARCRRPPPGGGGHPHPCPLPWRERE